MICGNKKCVQPESVSGNERNYKLFLLNKLSERRMTEEHIENKILWSSNTSVPLDTDLLNDLANNNEITPEINEIKPELTLDELLIKIASLPKLDITIDTPSIGLLDETSLQSPHKSPHTSSFTNTMKVAKYETQMPITTGMLLLLYLIKHL